MSSFSLKIIALISMFIDHFGYTFQNYIRYCGAFSYEDSVSILIAMTSVGRLAFPIYAFLLAESCNRTKNLKKFTLRLLAFALISEIPFDLARRNVSFPNMGDAPVFLEFEYQNIFFTLFLAAFAVMIFEECKKFIHNRFISGYSYILSKIIPFAAAALLIITASHYLESDYGAVGTFGIFLMYLAGSKPLKLGVMCLMILALYCNPVRMIPYVVFAGLSVFIVSLYNGKRGLSFKELFYWAYPVHLAVYANVWLLFALPAIWERIMP